VILQLSTNQFVPGVNVIFVCPLSMWFWRILIYQRMCLFNNTQVLHVMIRLFVYCLMMYMLLWNINQENVWVTALQAASISHYGGLAMTRLYITKAIMHKSCALYLILPFLSLFFFCSLKISIQDQSTLSYIFSVYDIIIVLLQLH
jgi:hypothetical protein